MQVSGGRWQPQVAGGGNDELKGRPETGWLAGVHSQVPGLGHRVSGSGIQVQVQVPGLNPNLYLYPYLQPRPETRDDVPTANRLPPTAIT